MAMKQREDLLKLAMAQNDDEIRFGCPAELKGLIAQRATELKMTAPRYMRYIMSLAVIEGEKALT